MSFVEELQHLINRHSQENQSGTPDFILASFLTDCLTAFSVGVNDRERWYGRQQDPNFGTPVEGM
jgi:hypothetical protein